MTTPAATRIAALGIAAALSGCSSPEPGRLAVVAGGPAVAEAQFFHGNCFAGWSVLVPLRVRETGGADVWLDGYDFRIVDAGLDVTLADQSLDSAALADNRVETLVPAHGSRLLAVAGRSEERPVGPLVVSGSIRGRDEHANAVAAPFRLTASSLDVRDREPPEGGACTSPE